MGFTEFRLKLRHFFRKYGKIVAVIFLIWAFIFLINLFLRNRPMTQAPSTTYEPHVSVIDTASSTPKYMQSSIEEVIEEYIGYCNEGNYQKAFNMISEDCRNYEFNNNVEDFMRHVLVKMPVTKKYAIQNYSNTKYGNTKIYIYEVKYTDDLLATGLTNSTYSFTSEKITFYEDKEGNMQMNVGDYIYHSDIKSISENEYLKIDVIDKVVNYSTETYKVKFTNRSKYTVVISDGMEENEIILTLPNESRELTEKASIVLKPNATTVESFTFPKFIDDGDVSGGLVFSSIRVMEKYSGTLNVDETIIKSEIDNSISKFSMEVNVSE